jgi:hypothetical protein
MFTFLSPSSYLPLPRWERIKERVNPIFPPLVHSEAPETPCQPFVFPLWGVAKNRGIEGKNGLLPFVKGDKRGIFPLLPFSSPLVGEE